MANVGDSSVPAQAGKGNLFGGNGTTAIVAWAESPLDKGRKGNYGWAMQTLSAHFDGRFIVLDEPAQLEPNAKVTVLAPDANERLVEGCARLSETAFQKVWDNPLDADYDRL